MFRLLCILFYLWQVNLFKMAKYWDGFLSHHICICLLVLTSDCEYCRTSINSDGGVTCDTSIQNWPFGHSTSDLWHPKFFGQSLEWKLGLEQNGMDFHIGAPILACSCHIDSLDYFLCMCDALSIHYWWVLYSCDLWLMGTPIWLMGTPMWPNLESIQMAPMWPVTSEIFWKFLGCDMWCPNWLEWYSIWH